MIYHDEAERDAAWRAIEAACPGVELTSSLPRNMEVNAPGVTKGSGHPVKGKLAGCGHCVLRTRCEYRKRGKTCASE